jgi:multidrug resistance efflux pump
MLKRINHLTAQLKTAREEIERMNATHAEEEAKAKAAEDARYASLSVLPEYLTKEDRELLDQYSAELERYEYSIEYWQNGFNSGEGVTLGDKSYTAEECAKHVASLSRSVGIFQTKREAILNNARQKMRDDLREFRKTKEGNVGSTPKTPIVKPSAITGRVTTRVVQPGLAGSTSVRESNSGNTRPANAPKTQDEARAWFGRK